MLRLIWEMTRGYRLRPWRSPYLRWRVETYSGIHADSITCAGFWKFAWVERRELWRYLRWAGGMRVRASRQQNPAGLRERAGGASPRG